MTENTFSDVSNALQRSHDLIRSTGLNQCVFSVYGQTWQLFYAEPLAVEYNDVVAYKVVLSRLNAKFWYRDQIKRINTENIERFVVVDKEWRAMTGYNRSLAVKPGDYGLKKIMGHGDTLDGAHWLHQRRTKWATVMQLTAAA